DAPDPVVACQLAQAGDQVNNLHWFSLKGRRFPAFEVDRLIPRLIRRRRWARRPCVDFLRRLDPRVLEDPAFNRPTPKVLVRAVRRAVVDRDGNSAFLRIRDLLFPGHSPLPRGRDDRGREPTRSYTGRTAPGRSLSPYN